MASGRSGHVTTLPAYAFSYSAFLKVLSLDVKEVELADRPLNVLTLANKSTGEATQFSLFVDLSHDAVESSICFRRRSRA